MANSYWWEMGIELQLRFGIVLADFEFLALILLMVGKRFELLRIAEVVSRNFRLKTNFPYSTLPSRQKWSYFSDGLEGGGSSVYEHALKFQRPSTIKYSHDLKNSVSLIGRVVHPLKRVNTASLGVYTLLSVVGPDRGFRILLKMEGWLAQECLNHMKEYDLIYVNGHLESYSKRVEDGLFYKVNVKEINYVAPVIGPESSGKTENSLTRGEDVAERWRSRLHLWQVFFASPYEWTDLRKSKTNPRQPDFKHKSTGEALWLSRRDPPWLSQQLQKLDSAMKDQSPEEDQRPYLAGHFL